MAKGLTDGLYFSKAAFAAREPTLIEVPVGPLPSPWEFIHMPRVRGL